MLRNPTSLVYLSPRAVFLFDRGLRSPYHLYVITKEEVDSLLGCAMRFDSWARQRIAAYDRATARQAKANHAARMEQEEREAEAKRKRKEGAKEKANNVSHIISSQAWRGIVEFKWTNKLAHKGTASLLLDEEPLKVEPRKAVFPQILITPKHGKPVVITILGCKGCEVASVKGRGKVFQVEMEVA